MRPGRAVVVGAGIAGLLAARVLTEHFARVVVLDRDPAGTTEAGTGVVPARRGVPQGGHLHGLLDRGRAVMEELHPGLTAELVGRGARTAEPLVDTRWYLHGRRLHPGPTGLRSILSTRPLLEDVLRSRTAALPGVVVADATVTGLHCDAGVVRGVWTRDCPDPLTADLVVDASGRGSRIPDWLDELGLTPPPEERVDVDLGYTSRLYRREPWHLDGDLAATVSTVPRSRGGGLLAVEGDRWSVTLAGMQGDHPPVDDAGFRAFAASLPTSAISEVVEVAEPLDDPRPYRFRGSCRRRFDRAHGLPEGLVVVGDAVCSLNPLYAQGMSVAAMQVLALRDWLSTSAPAAALHRRIARVCDGPWEIATRADLALTGADRPWTARLRDDYIDRMQRVAHRDPVVARAVIRVANLTDPAAAATTPEMLLRTLRPGAAATSAHSAETSATAGNDRTVTNSESR
ncbi:MAG: hypothetical protein ABS81_00120 [Pseudonocardia sp. SCN 72-86]|nr:MAG: hypothetical protein ABS81_00120 [Pseudonocardia sp. SCN 72-86]